MWFDNKNTDDFNGFLMIPGKTSSIRSSSPHWTIMATRYCAAKKKWYCFFEHRVPSGTRFENYGQSQFLMAKPTKKMANFNSYFDITRGYPEISMLRSWSSLSPKFQGPYQGASPFSKPLQVETPPWAEHVQPQGLLSTQSWRHQNEVGGSGSKRTQQERIQRCWSCCGLCVMQWWCPQVMFISL